jgi:DNA-binding LytR/AlgR family response regulator
MKPFDAARLFATVTRLKERIALQPPITQQTLAPTAAPTLPSTARNYLRWINASQGDEIRLITIDEVLYFKADNKYTLVVTEGGSESLIRIPIRELIEQLDAALFWQIHRSTVVNANAIAGVSRDVGGHLQVKIKNRSERLQVSETYAYLFKQM